MPTPDTPSLRAAPAGRLLCAGLLLVGLTAVAQAQSFWAEGSDTGGGIGARYVALGGTGVGIADDAHATFYNPAGLAEVEGFELALSRQLNARLHPFNFVGAAWRLPLEARHGLKLTVAAAYYPRIHARASGAFDEADFESVFLRYLLPGIAGSFDGDIDTKTKSYRLAVGAAPLRDSRWSFGAYVERIDCRSDFCGVHATSNGFTTSSTGAKAVGYGVGLRYRPTPAWTLAASVSDLNTRLTVNSVTTDDAGTRTRQSQAKFPRKIAFGAAWRAEGGWLLAGEYEITKGEYGSSELDIQVLRAGAERTGGDWTYRVGAVAPIRIRSSSARDIETPFPFAPTVGLGWQRGGFKADLALYAHPLMSTHEGGVSAAADLSLTLRF